VPLFFLENENRTDSENALCLVDRGGNAPEHFVWVIIHSSAKLIAVYLFGIFS
jgi:hypothetical protein